ncbi:MAG: FliM/FliN family flagellar motor switch protein [Pseudomonadota bacterium]
MNVPTDPLVLSHAVVEPKLALRRVSPKVAYHQTALSQVIDPLTLGADGAQILVGLDAPRSPAEETPWLQLALNGGLAAIQIPWGTARQIAGTSVEAAEPQDIALVLEDSMAQVLDAVEAQTGLAFRFQRMEAVSPALPVHTTLNLHGKAKGGRLIQMRLPVALSIEAADALTKALEPRRTPREDLPGLGLRVSHEIGWTVLPFAVFQHLDVGDAFEMPSDPSPGWVFIEESLRAQVRRDANTLILQAPFEIAKVQGECTMSELQDETARKATVDEIDVRLSFRAGEKQLSIRELSTLAPGAIIETTDPASLEVDILANGRIVGAGELIDVGGRRAIQIRRIFTGT